METNNRKPLLQEDLRKLNELFMNAPIPKENRGADFPEDRAEFAMLVKQEYPAYDVYINGKKVEGIISLHYGIPNE